MAERLSIPIELTISLASSFVGIFQSLRPSSVYDEAMSYQEELISMVQYYIKDYRELDGFWGFIDNLK